MSLLTDAPNVLSTKTLSSSSAQHEQSLTLVAFAEHFGHFRDAPSDGLSAVGLLDGFQDLRLQFAGDKGDSNGRDVPRAGGSGDLGHDSELE